MRGRHRGSIEETLHGVAMEAAIVSDLVSVRIEFVGDHLQGHACVATLARKVGSLQIREMLTGILHSCFTAFGPRLIVEVGG
jgi:hypothetical protein